MSTPPNVPSIATTMPDWVRRAAQAINLATSRLLDVGPTTERPARPDKGQMRWNETTKKPEWYDTSTSTWRDATGAAV